MMRDPRGGFVAYVPVGSLARGEQLVVNGDGKTIQCGICHGPDHMGLGAVPGIGAAVIDWIAYGHALRSEKGASETFGKGDVRGVIASESSNNAKEGGSLVSTIAFGVPATAAMALLLGAFLIHGITPGPDMLSTRLDVTYTLVWTVALANILGSGICFLFANQLAGIARIRIGLLAPIVLSVTFALTRGDSGISLAPIIAFVKITFRLQGLGVSWNPAQTG